MPIRTFNDWNDPPPGFCEIDMVAHGGTSVAGSFIQTLTMVDIATGWTECLPLVARDGSLVVEAMTRAQSLFPWLIRGADFDNDSAFMNDVVVPWCREQKIEVTRSRAYKKNDQAFVEQKNGAVVRQLVGYDRFASKAAYAQLRRVYRLARLHVNFFQPVQQLVTKHRAGARVQRVYDRAQTPYQRLCRAGVLAPTPRAALEALYQRLNPLQLRRDLDRALERLWALAAPDPHRQSPPAIAAPSSKPSQGGSSPMASVTRNSDLTEPGQ